MRQVAELESAEGWHQGGGDRTSQGGTLCVFLSQVCGLGWFAHRFIHQQNRNVVAHRINASTLSTPQALTTRFEHQRFSAHRADQHIEQLLGDHAGILDESGFIAAEPNFADGIFGFASGNGEKAAWQAGRDRADVWLA